MIMSSVVDQEKQMNKLFVLVRKDLEWPVRAVQASHAVADFLSEHGHDQ